MTGRKWGAHFIYLFFQKKPMPPSPVDMLEMSTRRERINLPRRLDQTEFLPYGPIPPSATVTTKVVITDTDISAAMSTVGLISAGAATALPSERPQRSTLLRATPLSSSIATLLPPPVELVEQPWFRLVQMRPAEVLAWNQATLPGFYYFLFICSL